MSGGSLPRRVLPPSEDEGENEFAAPPAATAAPSRTGAYNPDQTFNFDESAMDLSMSILGTRDGPRRVPMRQALPRTDPAVAAAARRLALAHSIGRSNKRDESGSERTASPQEGRGGMADATFTLDDLRSDREGRERESMSVGERRAERSSGVEEELDATPRRTPRRTSPAKPTPTRTIKRRRSTLDQELRRSSIASSIAISATGNASFSMLTGEELPPGMLEDDDDDTVNFLKRMGEGEGGRYEFGLGDEDGDEDDFGPLEDEHMYVGVGTRPKTGGFLAHGGAGGPAVWTEV
ncbi:hypothetical protein FA13DRAFT_1788881 [Coprinellus micaceus]|uniref:Uncharacterized protein n=1 Tax=Coprinellus micaceus TaxID=71717 RepID=A0A4Y7TJT4_COPMI|nr:hypothetical protein FA13DRAFT_1788881 [Coprinellus micaceus]